MRLIICISIIIICFIVLWWAIVHMVYFILGLFPFLSAKKLSETDIENIKKLGVIHKTTSEGKNGIEKEQKIKGSKGIKAYSTHFRKGTYFFATAYIDAGEEFNNNLKYEYIISINKLTDKQIQNFMIRDYDKALIYKNDFVIEQQNIVEYESIQCKKYSVIEKFLFYLKNLLNATVDKYVVALIVSIGITIGILRIFFYFICKFI